MEKGTNSNTRYALNYIGTEKVEKINAYIARVLNEDIKVFASSNEIEEAFNEFLNTFYERIYPAPQ